MCELVIFYHPDYTVGIGISPIQPFGSQTITAGREFHPALKILLYHYTTKSFFVKKEFFLF